MIDILTVVRFIESSYGINATWLYKIPEDKKLIGKSVETRIKELLDGHFLFTERNSIARRITTTYLNTVFERSPTNEFANLNRFNTVYNEYNMSVSDIRKLLRDKKYLVDALPSQAAFDKDVVFTKFTKRGFVTKIWKTSFLDKLIRENSEILNLQKKLGNKQLTAWF